MAPKITGMDISQSRNGFEMSCLSNDSYKLFVLSIDSSEIMGDNPTHDILLNREAVKKYAFNIIKKAYSYVAGGSSDIDVAIQDAIMAQSSPVGSNVNARFAKADKITHRNYEQHTPILLGRFNPEDKVFVFIIYDNESEVAKAIEGSEKKDYLCALYFVNNNESKYVIKEEVVAKKGGFLSSLFGRNKQPEIPTNKTVYIACANNPDDEDDVTIPDGQEVIFLSRKQEDMTTYSQIFNYGSGQTFQMSYEEYTDVIENRVSIVSLASIIAKALEN